MKKTRYLTIIILSVTLLLILTSNPSFASGLDFSRGVMPDSPLYPIDLNLEKLTLISAGQDTIKQAKLHFQYSTERLNELDYLTSDQDIEISNIIDVSDEYQKSINKFAKLLSTSDNSSEIEGLPPQIDQLQAIQTKVVDKINNQQSSPELKIVVKSAIKESQAEIIQAVESAKKPIKNSGPNSENSVIETKLDKTIKNLSITKEQLSKEIKQDEITLKSETKVTSPVTTEITNIKTNSEISNKNNPENISSETDSPEVSLPVNPEISNQSAQWYYSPSCDYVSIVPGKDPVCGEDMIAVSTLAPDHSFFSKYIYKDDKYIQNIDDLIQKEEDKVVIVEENTEVFVEIVETPEPENSVGNPVAESTENSTTDL
ncbi:hypothetical protein KJ855_00870 [Patescibacteria group bacterium]|nr:hypothetical protein [Patescibacteria group bacterium]